ncbi:MAG TPA: 16S rRNA (guanine(966)-N(2))-methyltransferase RsmD [Candidatus Limnocylindria bacterium]|jgi:16S rRNA (guanine(966)-N(2))-methyltransferase RsmD
MRVIAGEAKGRTLVAPKGTGTRPATDRIRETLFAILEPSLPEARVLDLFAGAGTLGIEALSRGAGHVTFVERAATAVDALRKNLAATGFTDRSDLVAANVLGFLERAGPPASYELVFVDPPFADLAVLDAVLAHPSLARSLARNGTVVARALRKHPPTLPPSAHVVRTKEIGEEDLIFLRYSGAGGGG